MNIEKLNDHFRAYGGTMTTAERIADIERIEAEIDAAINPTLSADQIAENENQQALAVKMSNDTNEYLINLKATDSAEFERIRKMPFTEQCALCVAAKK